MSRRRGFTLIELQAAMLFAVILLGVVAQLLNTVMHLYSATQSRSETQRRQVDLLAAVAEDVYQATAIISCSAQELILQDQRNVQAAYRWDEGTMRCEWSRDGELLRREAFFFPEGTRVNFELVDAPRRVRLRIEQEVAFSPGDYRRQRLADFVVGRWIVR